MDTLRKDILDRLKKKLSSPKLQKQFVDVFIDTALKNPKSYASQRMLDIIIPEDTLDQLDRLEYEKANEDISLKKYRLYSALYDKQQRVLDCIGKNRTILCITSRRCGKSYLDACALVYESLEPNSQSLYLNITYGQALNQVLDNIIMFADKAGLKVTKVDKTNGEIIFANGSIIRIKSNQNKSAADKLRGYKYKLIVVDEVAHQSNLDYLLDEVLLPAQTDYERPTLLMTGTPSRVPHHFSTNMFLDETNNVKKFNWSMIDNPFLPNPKQAIKDACERKGITEEDPFIQREYYGKFVADTEALVVPKRTYKTKEFKYDGVIIGVDYGFTDSTSVVSVGYNHTIKKAQVIEEIKFNRKTATEIMDSVEKAYKNALKYSDNVTIYADTNEQSLTADLRLNRKLPAFNCYKYDKQYAIELLSDCCRNGSLEVIKDGVLDREFEVTLYERDDDDNIIHNIDDTQYHPDAMFALLYAMRRVFKELNFEDAKYKESAEEIQWYQNKEGSLRFHNYNDDLIENGIVLV